MEAFASCTLNLKKTLFLIVGSENDDYHAIDNQLIVVSLSYLVIDVVILI